MHEFDHDALKMRSAPARAIRLVPAIITLACFAALMALPFAYRTHQRRKVEADALWERNADQFVGIVYNQLKSYCLSQTNFPALTAEELHQRGIFDDQTLAFLKLSKVHFYPFSSADPDTKIVLSMVVMDHPIKLGFGSRALTIPLMPIEFTKGDLFNTNISYGLLNLDTYR